MMTDKRFFRLPFGRRDTAPGHMTDEPANHSERRERRGSAPTLGAAIYRVLSNESRRASEAGSGQANGRQSEDYAAPPSDGAPEHSGSALAPQRTPAGNISAYCEGKPRTVASSHSGTITVALSLQEPIVFLSTVPRSSNSYRAHDGLVRTDSRAPQSNSTVEPPAAGQQQAAEGSQMATSAGAVAAAGESSSGAPGEPANGSATRPRTGSDPSNGTVAGSPRDVDSSPTAALPDDRSDSYSELPPAIVRGSVVLKLNKPTKLKLVGLSFYVMCKTTWMHTPRTSLFNENSMQQAAEINDVFYVTSHDWEFLPAANRDALGDMPADQSFQATTTDIYGADVVMFKNEPGVVHTRNPEKTEHAYSKAYRSATRQTESDADSAASSSAAGAGNIPLCVPFSSMKRRLKHPSGNKKDAVLYPAGEYVFNFSVAIDPECPETVKAPSGEIVYMIVPKIVRAGAFNLNITAQQELQVIRSPPNSCDMTLNNPILISRSWDERLQYEIMVAQKYMPINTCIPMSFRLLPLQHCQIHQIKVYVVEMVNYVYSVDDGIKSSDSSLRLLLYQKTARPTLKEQMQGQSKFVGNLLETNDDGELTYEPTIINLNIDLRQRERASKTEIPQSSVRQWDGTYRYLQPDTTSTKYIRIKHRLLITMRVTKFDEETASARHFEVKIDTPIILLSNHCIQDNIELPQYDPVGMDLSEFHVPGFPDFGSTVNRTMTPPPEYDEVITEQDASAGRATMSDEDEKVPPAAAAS